ncbi:MAG: MMPL family transporter [Thermoleophilia bacterium]
MSLFLARLAGAIAGHWKRAGIIAIIAIIAIGAASVAGGKAADDFTVPGAESQKAVDLFQEHNKTFAGVDANLVFSATEGVLDTPARRQRIEAALAEVEKLPHVTDVSPAFGPDAAVSDDGRIASVTVRYDVDFGGIKKEDGTALEDAARAAEGDGVEVAMRGTPIDLAQEQSVPIGELVGVAVALVLLTLLFRSGAAMAATLIGALLGVFVGQMLIGALSQPLGLPEFAATIALMLGLGAGIDYALLIIGRFREQLAAGDDVRDAVAKSAATSGATVVAAGLIVMVAIAGLLLVGIPLIGKLGIGTAIGVAAVVVSAITILPILMAALSRWLRPKKPEHTRPSPAFQRWGTWITGRPWVSIALGIAVLLIFAFPVLDMRLGNPDDGNKATSTTQRQAYDKLSEAFGPGSNGPFLLAVTIPDDGPETQSQLAALETALKDTPGVAKVNAAIISEDKQLATIIADPTTAPQDAATSDLLSDLRDDVIPAAVEGTPLHVYVGGQTAGFEDFSAKVASRLIIFIAAVIGLSVLLLIMAFRSLLIPLVSAVFNILSVLAAYGVVTAVFQDGVGAGLIGVDGDIPIISFFPVMLFAILFGLSMDYNVFLLSRVHEAYNEGDGPRESVVHGMSRIGKVILVAGLIMASVFLAFMITDDVIQKMFGLGLGLAVLIDVLIVRLVIAPAVVTLLGHKAWWIPAWLDRILPNISLEGHLVQPNGASRGVDKDPEPDAA